MSTDQGNTATETQQVVATAPPRMRHLPLYRVLLHNDDENTVDHVVESIMMLAHLPLEEAIEKTHEAHVTGCSLLLVIHRERAELYVDQFRSRSLIVTIEPVD